MHKRNYWYCVVIVLVLFAYTLSPLMTVQADADYDAQVSVGFLPKTIGNKEISRLTISIANPNAFTISELSWTDSLPFGLTVAATSNLTSNCGGAVIISSDKSQISILHGYIAANSSCSVAVDVIVSGAGTYDNTITIGSLTGVGNNGTVSNVVAATSTLTASSFEYPSTLLISLNPDFITKGASSQFIIEIYNPNSFPLTNASLAAMGLPTGVTFADTPVVASNCGGTVTANSTTNELSFSGVTVPAKSGGVNGECEISVYIKSNTIGDAIFSIPVGGFTANGNTGIGNVANLASVSSVLHVATISIPVQINKKFIPATIYPGEESTLNITIYNPNTVELTSAAWTDNLIGVQPGLRIANVPGVVNDGCGGSVTANPGGTSISLSGGTIPAKNISTNTVGQCTISVKVTSTTQGNLTNTIQTGTFSADLVGGQNVSNTDPASHTLNINNMIAPTISKSFTPNTVWVEGSSQMAINISNPDAHSISQVALTDVLPANVVVATPTNLNIGAGCGSASVDVTSGSGIVYLHGASIAAGATCTINVDVKSAVPGVYFNRIEAGAINSFEAVTNAYFAQAQLNVQATEVTKQFSPASFEAGEETTLTITLENRDKTKPYTNVGLVDVLPAPLYYKSATTTCRVDNIVALSSTGTPSRVSTLTLSGGTLPQASVGTPIQTCTITAVVSAAAGSVKSNTNRTNMLAPGALTTDEGVTNLVQAQANVTITPITVAVSKVFSVPTIQAGGDSILTVTVSNQTSKDIHNISLLDSMPVGLLLNDAYTPTTTCTLGTPVVAIVAANPPTTTTRGLKLSGVTLLSKSSCTFSAHVTTDPSLTARTLTNTIPAEVLQSDEEVTNLVSASRGLTVYTTGLGLTGDKSFSPTVVMVGATTRMTIRIFAPQDRAISNLSVTDNLPSGMVFADSPNPSVSCGGGASVSTDGTAFVLSAGSIAATGTCTFSVNVKGTEAKTFTNTISAANVTSGTTPEDAQTLSQSFSGQLRTTNLQISKAFYPETIGPEGLSTLTITLTNTNSTKLVSVNLTDTFPAVDATNGYFIVAQSPNVTTTCGVAANIITATEGSNSITMTGGEIPAQVGGVPGVCTISVNVQGKRTATVPTIGKVTNTIAISDVIATIYNSSPTATLQPVASASDDLFITGLTIGVIKTFDPLTVFGGTSSVLSITMVNENSVTLTGINLTDVMPDGMYIANPPNLSTGTCGGTLMGTAGSRTITFSNGVLTALKRCTVTLNVTMNKNGNLTNTINARGINSFNGAYNTQSASATLTNLPGVSITKYFTPSSIVLGEQSTLTIEITNTGNVPLDGMNFSDTLPGTLPNGLSVAAGTIVNSCNGALDASVGSNSIALTGGSILAGPGRTCTITVPVSSTVSGTYVNTIPARNLVTNQKATNSDAATDTLKITAAPDLQLIKTGVVDVHGGLDITKADAGDVVNYTLVATNLGDVTLNHVTITDPKLGALTCVPDPASLPDNSVILAKGEKLSCTGTYTLVEADITTQSVTNTASVASKLPDGVTDGPVDTDTAIIPLNKDYAVGIKKEVTSAGPFKLGTVVHYLITATNQGVKPITEVTLSDPNVTLGSCTPAQGSTLAPGATLVCQATYTILVADVDLGSYTNTATVTAKDEANTAIPSASDTAVVPIKQSASIALFKEILTDGPYTLNKVVEYEISAKNTGEQTLTNVTITDPTVTFSPACSAVTLLPEQTVTCSATHTISAQNMSDGGYKNIASVSSTLSGGGVGPTDSATKTIVTNQPKIALTKVGTLDDTNSNGRADAGEHIDYAFSINNNGPVTLTNVVLADIIGGVTISGEAIGTLAVGATDSTNFTGTYVLKQSDIDTGSFTNTAIVTGTPPVGSPVSASATDLKDTLSKPSISVDKVGARDLTVIAPNTRVDAGDKIDYTFTVTNTGNVALTGVVLSDSKFTVAGNSIGSLAIGATRVLTYSYTLTQTDVNAGAYDNTASVVGTPPTGSNVTDTSTVEKELTADPQITIDKTGTLNDLNSNNRADAGETVTYAFTVSNPGNVTLTGVAVTDAKVTVSGSSITLLPSGTSTGHFTGTYTLKQSDIDTGSLDNTATVTGTKPVGGTITKTDGDHQDFVQKPSITLVKTGVQNIGSNDRIDAGETITYSFKVTNTGNVTLTNVTVTDSMFTVTGSPIASLPPGETTLTASHTVTQAEIDANIPLHNDASVVGTPPRGSNVTAADDDTQTLVQAPSIGLVKNGMLHNEIVAPSGVTNPGDTIVYTFTVTNTGNVTLHNITITDPLITVNGGQIDTLSPGSAVSSGSLGALTGTYVLLQTDINNKSLTNTATVHGLPSVGVEEVTNTATKTINGLSTPSITLTKSGALDMTVVAPTDRVDVGDKITYTFVVTNTGNVPLSNVTVTDPKATVSGGLISLGIGAVDSSTFTATYTLTQTDVNAGTFTNTATVTGTPPTGIIDNVSKTASDTKSLPAVRLITLDKTGVANLDVVLPNGIANAGDKVVYSFYVTNPGNVTLTNVRIVDLPGMTTSPTSTTLAPGANATLTATYTLTQANVDAGTTLATFINNATAYGKPPLVTDISTTDSDSKSWSESPSITLEKTGTLDKTVVGPTGIANVGDKINYTFKVTNTGNVTLSGVTVSDSNPSVSITGANIGSLAPGTKTITGTYTLTQADVDAATFTNTASVTGTSPFGTVVNSSDGDTQSFPASPSIGLVKTGTLHQNVAGLASVTDPNDTITYAFTITNTGNVTLHNITLTDPKLSVIGGPTLASLVSGASSTIFSGTYSLTQIDISSGTFTNTATTTGSPPTGNSVSNTDDDVQNGLSTPSISLVKSAVLNQGSNSRMDAGETITYHFTVTNTGNVPLTNVRLTDPKITVSGGPISLGIGASDSATFSGTYTVSQAEINSGTIANTATVTGTPPTGIDVTGTSTVNQALIADKKITLVKTGTLKLDEVAPNDIANVGDKINYTFTVVNPGNVPLTGIVVTDPKISVIGGAIVLGPGENNTNNFTGSYTLTQSDLDAGTFTNTATVTGTPPIGSAISATASDSKNTLSAPSVNFVKTGVLDMTVKGLPTVIDEGDKINYTFSITNTGNVPLTEVMVTDANSLIPVIGSAISLPLKAADTTSFTASYTLTQADINNGSFTNTATVTAKTPSNNLITNESSYTTPLTQVKTLSLVKEGTLNITKVPLDTEVNAGDIITYKFTVKNAGNVTLTNVIVTDPLMTVAGTPIASLAPGAIDDTTFSGVYTLKQADIDLGTFNNTATVSGNPPSGDPTTSEGISSIFLVDQPIIGVAKRITSVEKISAGTHDVTFEILVKNYGNVTLHDIAITDDLTASFPLPTTFTVKTVTAADPLKLQVNPAYNGSSDTNLLILSDTINTLEVGESKVVTVVVTVIPTAYGPFMNTAVTSGMSPTNVLVTDDSQAGINPDPDNDKNPKNNNEKTSANFTANIFDPPSGIKTLDANEQPYLKWTMVWINETNIVGVHAVVHDPIPEFTEFVPGLLSSGFGIPDSSPKGSTALGVSCTFTEGSTQTTTDLCYYEGPTIAYPRGQIIWEGTLGPDLGVTDPIDAQNAISISFGVSVDASTVVKNSAFIDSDLNGDGDALDDGERSDAQADFVWDVTPSHMPETGFAPNRISLLPQQTTAYSNLSDLWLEIPKVDIKMPIVGVPMENNSWDVSWLENQAGWLNETAYPTTAGNSVITGHVYLSNGKPGPFVDLKKLGWNDKIIIHVGDKQYIYRVQQVKQVKPNDLSPLKNESSSWVTLVTCQGYDEGSESYLYRQVVRAVFVETK